MIPDALVGPYRPAANLRPLLQQPKQPRREATPRLPPVLQSSRAPAQMSLFGPLSPGR